jgi:alpha-amylase/alpha-mannosidase (GH57 family)
MKIIVHGHFYQPPRENPWTGQIDYQPTAAPFHDWNERIHAECYRPNAFAIIETDEGEMLVNNFERISFNVGPTLMAWLEKRHPRTYKRIIGADATSIELLGAGNALAQAFHHTILPLSPLPHVRTEIAWGIGDFRYRFGRDPQGMWLPETAVNDDVLGAFIDAGIAFTLLAPHQAGRWREPNGEWVEASDGTIDTHVSYRYFHRDGSGRSITLFFYDAEIARQIAFQNAMASARGFLETFAAKSSDSGVTHEATDGETFGHHHKFGDIGLAYALFVEAQALDVETLNYERWLKDQPPELEVELAPGEGTSWSCAHGVGRWARDCGCTTRGGPGWNQKWRAPLRQGLEIVRDAADEMYERIGRTLLNDPWGARDRYVQVAIGQTQLADFLSDELSVPTDEETTKRAELLFELQSSALAMFTSCGWFFADIGDIETVQIMRYAARTLELMDELGGAAPRDAFLATLEQAKSNDPKLGTGADIFSSLF